MARRADPLFRPFGWDEPMPPAGGRARNGVYAGDARVRVLPPGVTGADLARAKGMPIAIGQIWRRGPQRVQVLRVTKDTVHFRELSHGSALRKLARWQFERGGVPERALGDGGDE